MTWKAFLNMCLFTCSHCSEACYSRPAGLVCIYNPRLCLFVMWADERNNPDNWTEEQISLQGKLTHGWPASLSLQSWTSRPCWGSTPTPTHATGRGWGHLMSGNNSSAADAEKGHPLGISQLITSVTKKLADSVFFNFLLFIPRESNKSLFKT